MRSSSKHLLTRPVGRPSKAPKVFYESFTYQTKSWDQARGVVANVEWHQGDAFPLSRRKQWRQVIGGNLTFGETIDASL